jgi:hemerythrin-like metal-binding protein
MTMFQWDESFSVNVKGLDIQHKVLIDMINQYHDAAINGKSHDSPMNLLKGLETYTIKHFTYEEKYFDKFVYADRIYHKSLHDDFRQKITDLKKKVETDSTNLHAEVSKFLTDWLFSHIKGEDKKYITCFNENGLT